MVKNDNMIEQLKEIRKLYVKNIAEYKESGSDYLIHDNNLEQGLCHALIMNGYVDVYDLSFSMARIYSKKSYVIDKYYRETQNIANVESRLGYIDYLIKYLEEKA